ncbi:hypothetical protein BDV24DRAFT_170370 [Aspergillus arachidicola]|uniref:Uncharacterized protein n=1 Tax=Aspergillus arachidicola TaxID=656916 RepID=A0A5N6XMU1_9EURO|nr:hypothetical protein BDV24DRAFT_170370 [Aspergillus arachidicola]
MRYTFIFTALASAALALPASPVYGTTLAQELQDDSLSQKLPFLPPPEVPCKNAKPTDSEFCLGTAKYCEIIDQNLPFYGEVDGIAKKENGRSYIAPGECLSAREPQPRPTKPAATASTLSVHQATSPRWKEPDSSKCRDNKSRSEDCLGTQRYCELGASRVEDKAKREKVQKDCEASRGGRPSAAATTGGSGTSSVKLPWHEGTHYDCAMAIGDEKCLGTKSYCRDWFNKFGNTYQSPEECEAAREPRPQA